MLAYTGPKPTIRHDLDMGITRCMVICQRPGCGHSAIVTYDRIALPRETVIVEIPRHRRFTCTSCGGHWIAIEGAWNEYRPQGSGLR